ncbi:ATP-binding cassette, subfamily C, bacterial LapB [Azospirillaceae bacterium]
MPPTPEIHKPEIFAGARLNLQKLNAFNIGILANLHARGDLAACLPPLLVALGWPGGPRVLAEALPTEPVPLDITELINLMGHFGFETIEAPFGPQKIADEDTPCLIVPRRHPAMVVLAVQDQKMMIHTPGKIGVEWIPQHKMNGKIYCFTQQNTDETSPERSATGPDTWLGRLFKPFQISFVLTLALTVFANIAGLASSLFVMTAYDTIVPSGDMVSLAMISAGAVTAILLEFMARRMRTRALVYGSIRLSYLVGAHIFQRLLNLPAQLTERASVNAQIARLKDVERVRELLTGPVAQAALDLPFVLVFLVCVGVIGGRLVFVPILAIILLVGIGLLFSGAIDSRVAEAAKAAARRQELVLEMIERMRLVRVSGGAEIWRQRFEAHTHTNIHTNFTSTLLTATISSIGYVLSMSAGLGAVVYGILLVFSNTLTPGGLIASTLLTWRILGPVQGALVAFSRMRQLRSSINQINNFSNFAPERPDGSVSPPIARVKGQISVSRVTFRYGRETEPVLGNLSFDISHGELVAVIGPSSSGKSTILKLIMGLYQTQIGSVRIDDRNLRQYDPTELRHIIGYIPQKTHIFHGTLAENIRMAAPLATDEQVHDAFVTAGALTELIDMPEGLNTPINNQSSHTINPSFAAKIGLARAFAKNPRIFLMDDPVNDLDQAAESQFLKVFDQLRGNATVLMVTHRPSHVRMCDKLLILQNGMSRYFGPVSEVPDRVIRESI